MNKWVFENDEYTVELGRILTMGVETIYEVRRIAAPPGYSTLRRGDPVYYKAFVRDNEHVYGEGVHLYDEQEFALSENGLRAAKARAVEFTRELLTEAMDLLDKVGKNDDV